MGVSIDILVVIFLIWSLIRGWKQGFLYQLGQMALMVLAYFVARGLGGLLADPIASGSTLSPRTASAIGFFAVFFVVVLIGGFFLRKLTRGLLSFSEGLGTTDHALGVILGAAKGALIAYLVIVGLIMAQRMTHKLPIPFGSSIAGRWVLQNNFLDNNDFPRMKALTKLAWLAGTRDDQTLASDPHIQALMVNPKTLALLADPEIVAALGDRDFVTLLGEEAVWDYLDDPSVQAQLDAIEWEEGQAHRPRPAEAPTAP